MQYNYRITDISGKIASGWEEAESREQLISKLKAEGKFVLDIQEKQSAISMAVSFGQARFSKQERLIFTQQLAGLLTAGIPLEKSLAILSKLKFGAQTGEVIHQIRKSLQEGLSISSALERFPKYFPPLYISMVKAGETGGILPQILTRLSQYLEEEINLKRFIIGSLFYPLILVFASLTAILFFVVMVIPQFKNIFRDMGSELPLVTQLVMMFGEIILTYWPILLVITVILIAWWIKEKASSEGRVRLDRLKLRIPLLGTLLTKMAVAKMTLALSMLYESGISLLASLNVAAEIMGNAFLAKALNEVEVEVRRGHSLSGSMAGKEVFPVMAVEMIGVGEESGSLGQMLQRVVKTYEDEVKHSLSIFLTILEPLLILVMVGVIAILAVAILLPIININNQINPIN